MNLSNLKPAEGSTKTRKRIGWIGRSCRFSPSCSNYTMQAILTHGCIKGILLGAWRIARCNPLGKWGYDPVPPPGRWQSPARNLQPAKLFCTRHKRKVEK